MNESRTWRRILLSDTAVLIWLALGVVALHLLTNGQYGFHRDELATLDDGRYLDWGYVAYPPITPFIGRVAVTLFGLTTVSVRFFSSVAQAFVVLLAGLMARELGGSRWAQIVAAVSVVVAPLSLGAGALLQYVAFDYLWWVLIAYLTIRLLKSEDPRWWLAIGATIGPGMMTKYTMGYLVLGIVGGVFLTKARRHLKSPWLWGGVALSILIFLPNLIWQTQHNFISLDFLGSIHARDVRIGRTSEFLLDQFKTCANPATIPIWIAGLYLYFRAAAGKRYRLIGWMYVIPLVLFIVTQGRGYYLAPAYPMLLAGGAVWIEQWLATQRAERKRSVQSTIKWALAIGGVLAAAIALPVAPINSFWWNIASDMNGDLKEEIGWPELVQTVAQIRDGLSTADRAQLGILAGNYGEAGAINLLGSAYGLPTAISGINSYWLRGYGDPPPQTLIVLGLTTAQANQIFRTCEIAGHITNRDNVMNEETTQHPTILVCHELRSTWPEFWPRFKYYG